MKALLWVLGLFAVAVGLVMAARYNNGYVLVVLPPWRAELSLNLAIIIALAIFLLAYAVVRTVIVTATMPSRVRAFQKQRSRSSVPKDVPAQPSMKRWSISSKVVSAGRKKRRLRR